MAVIFEFNDLVVRHEGEELPPVSFSIEAGEKVAVVFSRDLYDRAFLNFLLFLETDYQGGAMYRGKEFSSFDDGEIKNFRLGMGAVSPHLPMISNLKLVENVYLPIFFEKVINEKAAFEDALEILKIFGIASKFNVLPAFLSNHEKKLGLFARTWLKNPDIVYYTHIIGDTDKAKRAFIIKKIEEFHGLKDGRISILSERAFDDLDDLKEIKFDKIIKI